MREHRRLMQGRVISAKMAKTVIVEIEDRSRHPLYGKVVSRVRRFKAHNDEPVVAKPGDVVKIIESRPMSREKRWTVHEIVRRGEIVEPIVEKELAELRAQEEADRAARRVEEERRAAERLSKLAGEEDETAADETEESEVQ